ncbi:MAG TPA: S8 family peptidase, partial [Vicinamibacterales bacterium]|nr:S8 family peptidase [Vicinamibacterales bacterium]
MKAHPFTTHHSFRNLVAPLGLALLVGLLNPSTASAAGEHKARMSSELAGKLAQSGPVAPLRVIVSAPQEEVNRLAQLHGLTVVKRLASGVVFGGSVDRINSLAADEDIKNLEEDRVTYSSMAVATQSTGADQVWQGVTGTAFGGITGQGVGIAVLDSGYAPHADLNNRMLATLDFTDKSGVVVKGGFDDYGHGTHVAGSIAGSGAGSKKDPKGAVIGMAPGASLVSMKVLGADGSGYISDVIEAIDYCIKNRAKLGLRIINLSLGHHASEAYRDDPLALAVERAVANGFVVVASAGNHGKDPNGVPVVGAIVSPGFTPGALTVGALNTNGTVFRSDDKVASYSSRGPVVDPGTPAPTSPTDIPKNALLKPDVVAPGNAIVSAMSNKSALWQQLPARRVVGSTGGTYLVLSGASMATGVTSGAVALLLQARPDLTPREVKTALQVTAQFIPDTGIIAQGAGSINVALAVKFAKHTANVPLTMSNTIGGERVVASGIAFGNASTWGSGLVSGNTLVWDSSLLRGDGSTWGQ